MQQETLRRNIISLFPEGKFWEKWLSEHSNIINVITNDTFQMLQKIEQLKKELDPMQATPELFLPYWEAFFALKSDLLSLEKRRDLVVTKLLANGGQSILFYKEFLRKLGYQVEINEYHPFKAGSKAGDALYSGDFWHGKWSIKFKNQKVYRFRAGSRAGDRLVVYSGLDNILRVLNKMKQAHTALFIKGEI